MCQFFLLVPNFYNCNALVREYPTSLIVQNRLLQEALLSAILMLCPQIIMQPVVAMQRSSAQMHDQVHMPKKVPPRQKDLLRLAI